MKNIIIGIVCKHGIINKKRTSLVIRDEIKNALFDNGANVIAIVPPCKEIRLFGPNVNELEERIKIDQMFNEKEKQFLISQISMCDGIVLQGGGISDSFEVWIAAYCYEHNIPILGICAGQNNMVRAVGGTTKLANNYKFHSQPNKKYVHKILIDKNSFFYQIVKKDVLTVNSRHKSTIDVCDNLDIAAFDEDKNIEIVEDKSKRFFVGVRFHPESLYEEDDSCNQIFKFFIDICGNV